MSNDTTAPEWQRAADALSDRFGNAPHTAFVLGSGMGGIADDLTDDDRTDSGVASFGEVGLPQTGVVGHSGTVRVGTMAARRVAALSGRVHLYEGRPMERSLRTVRALARWGVKRVVLTSAVGSLHRDLVPGSLVRVTDHVNLMFRNALTGPNEDALGPRFPDLTRLYSSAAGVQLQAAAADIGVDLRPGVYAATSGPSYETPAEVRLLALLGCDVVGMSLAAESTAAGHAGLEVVAVSIVSNFAAGLADEPLTHEDVTRVVGLAADRLTRLLRAFMARG